MVSRRPNTFLCPNKPCRRMAKPRREEASEVIADSCCPCKLKVFTCVLGVAFLLVKQDCDAMQRTLFGKTHSRWTRRIGIRVSEVPYTFLGGLRAQFPYSEWTTHLRWHLRLHSDQRQRRLFTVGKKNKNMKGFSQ